MSVSEQWLDFEAPEGAQPEATAYPVIQWFNGGQSREHPVLDAGGWELSTKWFEGIIGNAFPTYEVEHSGAENGTEAAYLFGTLHLAVVLKHVDFYRGLGREREWAAEYRPGFYSRVKLLCFVGEIERLETAMLTPVVVTFRSSVARDFNAVTRQFRADVLNTADRVAAELAREAGREAPDKFLPYAFWLPVGSAGHRVKVGSDQQSKYAPLTGKWNSEAFSGDREQLIGSLQGLATPPALRTYVRDVFYEEALAWREREKAKLADQIEGQEFTVPAGEEV